MSVSSMSISGLMLRILSCVENPAFLRLCRVKVSIVPVRLSMSPSLVVVEWRIILPVWVVGGTTSMCLSKSSRRKGMFFCRMLT